MRLAGLTILTKETVPHFITRWMEATETTFTHMRIVSLCAPEEVGLNTLNI